MGYQKGARYLTDYMLQNEVGRSEYREIYSYGFECMLATLGNILITLAVGAIMHITCEMALYMLFYGMLRVSAGGRHAKKHCVCIVTYLLSALAGIYGIACLARVFGQTYIIMVSLIVCNIIVFLFAPVGSKNKTYSEKLRDQLKKRSRWTVLILSLAVFALSYGYKETMLVNAALAAVLVESLTLIKRKREGE